MSRALVKKSLAFVKREAETRSDGEEKGGSKKKSVSFQRERKVEGDGRVGKKRKKQKTVDCITPTATEVSSVSEQNLLYFRKRKLISTRTIKNVVQYSSKGRIVAKATPTHQRPPHHSRRGRTGRTKAERKAERRKQFSVLNIPSLKSVTPYCTV